MKISNINESIRLISIIKALVFLIGGAVIEKMIIRLKDRGSDYIVDVIFQCIRNNTKEQKMISLFTEIAQTYDSYEETNISKSGNSCDIEFVFGDKKEGELFKKQIDKIKKFDFESTSHPEPHKSSKKND